MPCSPSSLRPCCSGPSPTASSASTPTEGPAWRPSCSPDDPRRVSTAMGTPEPPAPQSTDIPREFDRQVVLKDGAHVWLRAIRPADEPRLVDLYGRRGQHP